MMDGVFGFNRTKHLLQKELVKLRKQTLAFRKNSCMMEYEVTKYRYGNAELPRAILCFAAFMSMLLPIKYNIMLWSYIMKLTIGVGLGTAGTSIGVVGVAGVVMTSAAHSAQQILSIPTSLTNTAMHQTTSLPVLGRLVDPLIKNDPIFKPKFATVVLLSKEIIECKIINFTSDYIEVILNGEKKIIPQKDIYEIRGLWIE